MPPRLPSSAGAHCARPSQSLGLLLRPFSSTPTLAAPPRHPEGGSSSHHHSSSTGRLSTLNNARHVPSSSSHHHGSQRAAPSGSESMMRMTDRYRARAETAARNKQLQLDFLREQKTSTDYLKEMPRKWREGDVYAPRDMSKVEMKKWRNPSPRTTDVVDALGLSPLDMYKNYSLIQEFTMTSGQIRHSQVTRLRPVNQRKIAKMVRRAQGMGLFPTIHHHPELIRNEFFPTKE